MSDDIQDQTPVEEIQPSHKPPVVRRKTLVDVLLDRAATTTSDIIKNTIVPGAIDLMHDAFVGSIDAMFDRRSSGSRRRVSRGVSSSTQTTSFNYNGISSKNEAQRKRTISDRARAAHDFDDIIFQDRIEATDVLDRMHAHLHKYQTVSVDMLYSFMGVDPTVVDTSWGWDEGSFRGAHVRRIRNGFVLDIPEPSPL